MNDIISRSNANIPITSKAAWLNLVAAMSEAELTALLFSWLQQDRWRMAVLSAAEKRHLPNWCIGAGFVRNLVWDRLHGLSTPLNDIDVIYFDRSNTTKTFECDCERQLSQQLAVNWSVKNQARMHRKHGHGAYQSVGEAMRYWPERETAIAVTLVNGQLSLVDNGALRSLMALNLSMNPHADPVVFHQRVQAKGWLTHYQHLSLV